MLCTAIAASAAKPFVREGKYWKHSISTDWISNWSFTENTMYFGSPEELYGKTYFPVKATETDEVYAYMRQDGGKVYILVDGSIYEQLYYYQDDTEVTLAPGDEVLAYDFDANPGDTYMSVSSGDMGIYGICQILEVTVDAVDTVIVNGAARKRQTVHIDDMPNIQYTIVEGIGANEGLFFVPEYGPFTTGHGATFARIDEVTDIEGAVMFRWEDFDTPAYRPLVGENLTWNYDLYVDRVSTTVHESQSIKFGVPEELFGKTYWPVIYNNGEKQCYVRQEGERIYVLVDGECVSELHPTRGGYVLRKGDEALVYDFSADEGYVYAMFGDYLSLYSTTVKKTDKVLVNGVIRKRAVLTSREFSDREIIVVEGIGSNRGYMCQPQFMCTTTGDGGAAIYLKNVTDAEGNVIFTAADFDAPSYSADVPEVGFDTGMNPVKDNKMYDLNGREIRGPLPGTVYILNGEKHVAK